MSAGKYLVKSALVALSWAALNPGEAAHAATCLENRDYNQSLPTVIGREDETGKKPFRLNCDTLFVRKGVTTVVHPGSMLYFSRPTLNSVIKVEGTLIVRGTKNSYAYLSGSIDSGKTGPEPGSRPWGGIEVSEGGRLVLEYAGVMRAPTPLTTFTKQVRIVNCFFKGSSGIILPDGNLYPMEIKWHTINNLDLERSMTDKAAAESPRALSSISDKEKSTLLSKREEKPVPWRRVGTSVAVIAAVGGGMTYFLLADDEPGRPNGADRRDIRPGLPGDTGGR